MVTNLSECHHRMRDRMGFRDGVRGLDLKGRGLAPSHHFSGAGESVF